jgi:FKBP-type peptidyl-prolyl cis-trans isomerase 2
MDMTDTTEKILLRVENGRLVEMEYQVRLSSGKVVDSSEKSGGPVTFVCGKGNFPKPVEENIVGLAPGEKKVIFVPPNYTYGQYDPVNVSLVAIEKVSGEVEIGKVVKAPDEFGLRRPAMIKSILGSALMLDFNHPLAGKTLYFEVFVKDVRITTTETDN